MEKHLDERGVADAFTWMVVHAWTNSMLQTGGNITTTLSQCLAWPKECNGEMVIQPKKADQFLFKKWSKQWPFLLDEPMLYERLIDMLKPFLEACALPGRGFRAMLFCYSCTPSIMLEDIEKRGKLNRA